MGPGTGGSAGVYNINAAGDVTEVPAAEKQAKIVVERQTRDWRPPGKPEQTPRIHGHFLENRSDSCFYFEYLEAYYKP